MRALIGLLVLGALFIMAASWQNRMTSKLRGDRAQRYNIASDSVAGEEGWSRLILGRPSGADPLPLPERLPGDQELAYGPRPGDEDAWGGGPASGGPGGPTDPAGRSPSTPPPGPKYLPDELHVVQENEVLSTICQKHYEVRPLHVLVQRVATYNDLKSANDIHIGDELRLPDAAVLFPAD